MTQGGSESIMWEILQDNLGSSTNKWHRNQVCVYRRGLGLLQIIKNLRHLST